MRILSRTSLVLLILLAVRLSVFTVDASEFAYVTVLGRHTVTYDGMDGGAGLHIGWPWPIQAVQRLDRRIQQFDLPASEYLTPDSAGKVDKNLTVEAYVVWRIHDQDALSRFVPRIGTIDKARIILTPRFLGQLGASLGKKKMDDIINAKRGVVDTTLNQWHQEMLTELKDQVLAEYGIELIDVRLRRFNYPAVTSQAIFDRIKSERQEKSDKFKAEGDRDAANIRNEADKEHSIRLSEARAKEASYKAEADREALRIRNKAHSKAPEFYSFLKEMEKLQSILTENRTILLLSTHRPLFRRLFYPPEPGTMDRKK